MKQLKRSTYYHRSKQLKGDLNIETEEEKEALKKETDENKNMLDAIKTALGDKVVDVKLTGRLKSHPVCLSASEGVSFEMEKALNAMPNPEGQKVKAGRILEINPDHQLFSALKTVYEKDPAKINDYADILFDQALLIEGFPVDDPVAFSTKITNLMIEATK